MLLVLSGKPVQAQVLWAEDLASHQAFINRGLLHITGKQHGNPLATVSTAGPERAYADGKEEVIFHA